MFIITYEGPRNTGYPRNIGTNFMGGRRHHEDSDFPGNPWSETISWCGSDDKKQKQERQDMKKGRKYLYCP